MKRVRTLGVLTMIALISAAGWTQTASAPKNGPVVDRGKVTFVYPADGLSWVRLTGTFNGWTTWGKLLTRDGDVFRTTVELEPARRYEYKFLTSSDNAWANDPYNEEVVSDGFGWYNSVLALDGYGNRIETEGRLPHDRIERSEHFTLHYLSGETSTDEASRFLRDLEDRYEQFAATYAKILKGGPSPAVERLAAEKPEEYAGLVNPLREVPTEVYLGPNWADDRVIRVGSYGNRIFCTAGTGERMPVAFVLSHSLSGRFSTELGKFGFCSVVTGRLEGMEGETREQIAAMLNESAPRVKNAFRNGTFVALEKLAISPLNYFYNKKDSMPAWDEAIALYAYLFSAYPEKSVYEFARTGMFECLGEKGWAALEKKFLAWLGK